MVLRCHTVGSVTRGCVMIGGLAAVVALTLNVVVSLIAGEIVTKGPFSIMAMVIGLSAFYLTTKFISWHDEYQLNKIALNARQAVNNGDYEDIFVTVPDDDNNNKKSEEETSELQVPK